MQDEQALATVPQAARFLNVSESHLYRLMDRDLIPWIPLGRCRRIPWDALRAIVEAAEVSA